MRRLDGIDADPDDDDDDGSDAVLDELASLTG